MKKMNGGKNDEKREREWKRDKKEGSIDEKMNNNKAGYTATEVACGWAGAIFEADRPFGQEQ